MLTIGSKNAEKILKYFEDICAIPHGSGNCKAIADYCVRFAESNGLKYYRDAFDNVIIYKKGSRGREEREPIILQGHLDMVCQKTDDIDIDFEKDPLDIYVEDGYVKAKETTLGADNGIAVAMIMALLADKNAEHPPIEAVFTSDEEIGMIGAGKLDMSKLSAKRMINLDSEEDDSVTVSCAGGSDLVVSLPIEKVNETGCLVRVSLRGLLGGHSGVEIDKGRINSNLLSGRVLDHISKLIDFDIISISGGNKPNAIPNRTDIELCVKDPEEFENIFDDYVKVIAEEIRFREPGFTAQISVSNTPEQHTVFADRLKKDIIFALCCVKDGSLKMSAEIENLVETSLNLGILKTSENDILLHHALRSNKMSALLALEEQLKSFYARVNCTVETFGYYPPWEYKSDSTIREEYLKAYREVCGSDPKVEAIHAGLECGVFSNAISGLDCIAVGPMLYDVHTVNERLDLASVEKIFTVLSVLLKGI